ncbi:hypothetical protein DL767_006792 [Monosporascus sp. MG133]|nr:hypothetical protein DL767_006792 [Monosporascus sp. MG133]
MEGRFGMHFRRPMALAEFHHNEQLSRDSGSAAPDAVAELKTEHIKPVEQVSDRFDDYLAEIYGVTQSESALNNQLKSENFEAIPPHQAAGWRLRVMATMAENTRDANSEREQDRIQSHSTGLIDPVSRNGRMPGPATAGMRSFPSGEQVWYSGTPPSVLTRILGHASKTILWAPLHGDG